VQLWDTWWLIPDVPSLCTFRLTKKLLHGILGRWLSSYADVGIVDSFSTIFNNYGVLDTCDRYGSEFSFGTKILEHF
jgi:hypothetical protein